MRYLSIFVFVILSFIFSWQVALAAAPVTPAPLQQILQMQVDYTLPYPGILPDNFLYPIKTFRDKVISFFITDAQKQAEFDLLQADKRLAAGQYLLAEKPAREVLVSETVSKGENYFGLAIANIQIAQQQGKLVNNFLDTLLHAGMKHQQVLYQMAQVSHGEVRQDLLNDIVRVRGFVDQVNKLKH